MTTYLQLCKDVGRDSGLISSTNALGTVVGATGKQEKICNFVNQAWRGIQLRRKWRWMRGDFSALLVIGQGHYTPAELGIATRFGSFLRDIPIDGFAPHYIYDEAIGVEDSSPLFQVSPEIWEMVYGRGEQINNRPGDYALRRNGFSVGQLPNAAYRIKGQYWKAPQELTLDADEPDMPEEFHDVIKWRAMMMISGTDGAYADRALAQQEYLALYHLLVDSQGSEPIDMGPPLA